MVILMTLNETIVDTIDLITPAGVPILVRLLAIFGAFWLFSSLMKSGVNVIYIGAYLVGTIKWIWQKRALIESALLYQLSDLAVLSARCLHRS